MLILTTARYSFKYDYLQWFNLNDVIDCQENQVQVIGLGQYQCVSFLAQCNGLQGVQNIDYNGKKYLCNDKFQFNQQIKKLGEREFFFIDLIDISQYSIGIDFTAEGEISYALFQLDFECQLSFSWIDQNNQRQIDCLFCKSFYYNKKCSKWAEGYSEASIFLNSVGDVQCNICIYMKACNIKCKSCSYMYLNQCIECADFYYGNGCNNICSLSCDKETCNCFNGLFQSCKAGYIQEVNVDGSINCLALCGIYCSSCVQINSLYTCNQCGYYQKFGTKKFLDAQMVNDVCVGIENCLEYKKITNQFGQMSITCYFCFPGFYYKSDQMKCLECSSAISNCAFCSKYDPVDCIACQFGYYVNNDKTCSKSFIDCNSPCKFCLGSNKDFCTVCIENYYIANYLGNCVCSDGYFDSGNPTNPCQSCHPICATCTGGNISDCTSCKVDQNRKLVKGECICDVGFGEIDDTQQNLTCELCHNKCRTCKYSNNQQSCTSCKYEQNREVSETLECVCKENYGDNLGNLDICYKCHYTCGNCNGTTAQDCSYCTSNRYLTSNNECKCKKNYYENSIQSIICLSCHHSCSNCLLNGNEDNCTECPITRISSSNTSRFKCICKDINYFDDGINQECQQCHYSCKTCNGYQNFECLTCDITYRVQTQNNCQCPQHYYDIGDLVCSCKNAIYQECHHSCLTCVDNNITSCLTCSLTEEKRYFNESSCICVDGYFDDGVSISQCSYKCQTCQNAKDNCIECAQNSIRELGSNFSCECPSHFFDVVNEPKCQKCHFKCLTCSGKDEQSCLTCDDQFNRILTGQTCMCKPHYFELELENCSICSSLCKNCDKEFNNCTSCADDKLLLENKCICGGKQHGLKISTYKQSGVDFCYQCHYSCYTCNGIVEQNCLSCLNSEFRIFQNGKCPCIDGYVDVGQPQCKKCSYNCKNCYIQSTFCTSCQENSLRILNISVKSCPCQIGYFDDGSNPICQICNYTCESCQIKSTLCLTCPLNSQRILNDILQQCNCNQFYYDNGQKYCEQCHYSCLYCNGNQYNNCIQCQQTNLTFRYLKNNQCLCLDGYYDINSIICDKCQIQCLTCINQSFQCQSCVYTRKLQNNDCICKQGYYDIGYKDCIECNENCFECKLSSQNCISCNPLLFRELNQLTSKCVCMDGYIEINNLCEKCYYQCKTCSISKEQCDTCPINRKFVGIKCECFEDSYDNGSDCQPCSKSCQTCLYQSDYCLTCPDQSKRIFQSNKCICEDGYYDDQINISCEQCSQLCKTCIIKSTQCLSCNINFELDQITNTCECPKGQYYDNSTQVCLQCHVSCQECREYPKCTICISLNRYFNLARNQCDCQQGYFEENQKECTKCHYSCQICSISESNCLSCELAYHRGLIGNTCECLQGFYDVGIERCQQCSFNCETCFYSSTQCMKCYDYQFRVLVGNKCICKDGYFDTGSEICQKCSNSCLTCITLRNFCISCDVIQKRYDYSSIHKCPCLQGFYEDENETCQKCKPKCASCSHHQDQCLSCSKILNSNRFSLSQNCNCKEGYFDDGINVACQICDSICKTCSDKKENCIECFNNLRNTPPLCKCKDGFFEDQNKACLQCSNQCQTCIDNKSNCQTCKIGRFGKECKCEDGYYEADLEKCQPCYFQCQTCQLADKCLICKGDRIEPPYCYCQEGYFDDDQSLNCQPCDPTCKTCTISGCLTCNANRILSSELTCDPPEGSIIYDTTPWCSNCQVAVVKSQFSDDLSSVIIRFDFPLKNLTLNAFQSNLCGSVINNNTLLKLGTNYNCQISQHDQYVFIIQLDYESTLAVGDVIEFKQNVLAHTQCEGKLQNFIFTQVGLPNNPIPPFVQFDVPQYQLSPCVENQILYNLLLNDGKRQFIKISWNYYLEQSQKTDMLEQFMEEFNKLQELNLQIPKKTLPEFKNITFSVTVTNFINISSTFKYQLQTQTISEPSIDVINTNKQYYAYEKIEIKFIISIFSNCQLPQDQKTVEPKYLVNLTEIARDNHQGKYSNLYIVEEIQTKEYLSVLDEYSLSPLTLYTFQIFIEDQKTKQQKTRNFQIKVKEAKLYCKYVNCPKTQDYRNDLNLQLNCKDLNEDQEWNTDPQISIAFTCTDLVTSEQCLDKSRNKIQIQENSFNQIVKKLSVEPYTIQLWQAEARKNNLITTISQTVVFLEESILPQELIYSDWYLMRPINNYESLNFTFSISFSERSNLSSLSIGFIYDFQVVKILYPIFFENIIKIFDYFNSFQRERKISLYFQAQYTNSIAPRQTSLIFELNEPPNCGKLFYEKSLKNNLLMLKIGVKCSFSQFQPFRYKLLYFLMKQDFEDFQSGKTDYSLGVQEFQNSNIFQIYIPNPFSDNQLYFLIQVIDKIGGKSKIYDNVIFEKLNINCNIIADDVSDLSLKTYLMFSALDSTDNNQCQQLASKIYLNLIQEALEQENYSCLQTVKVYAKYRNLIDQQNNTLKRSLQEDQFKGCLNIEDNYFYLLKQVNDTNQTTLINIETTKTQIKLINKIFLKLNFNKQTLSQNLKENFQQWNQEISDNYFSTLSLYQSLLYFIDDILNSFETLTIQDEAIYEVAQNCHLTIDKIIQQILSDILIDETIYLFMGKQIQIQLQKLNSITLSKQLHLSTNIDDFLIKYYIKEQISLNVNPLQFSEQEQEKLQAFLNTSSITLQHSKLISQNLHLFTEFGKHVNLQKITKISINMKQLDICNDLNEEVFIKFQIECIQININNDYNKCKLSVSKIKQDMNKLQINCECEEFGQVFLSYSEIINNVQQVKQIQSDILDPAILNIDFNNPYLLAQIMYFILVILITTFLYYRDMTNIYIERLDAEESSVGNNNNMKNFIYPGHYQIIIQNYKFLHNILCLFQHQPDIIKRAYIFLQMAMDLNYSFYLSVYLDSILPKNFFPSIVFIQVFTYLIQKAFIKIVKGIMRINLKLRCIAVIFPIIQMISLTFLNVIFNDNFDQDFNVLLSTILSFLIYELIFEPILIVSRIHVYSLIIPQLRIKILNKTILMVYFFVWHWRLEEVMKQYQII